MRKEIRDIIKNSHLPKDEKYRQINSLLEEDRQALDILSGTMKYCEQCDDYYLARSFITETTTAESKVCVYEDWMNSGGNEYADGFVDTTWEICPKGHRHKLREYEREK